MDDRSQRLPGAAEIAEINARHLIQTQLRPADLLFVFGTREDVALRADMACRLWRKGLFRRSIVSGGVTCVAGVALTATWLHDFWSYDARTDEHAVAQRAARQLAGERVEQVQQRP